MSHPSPLVLKLGGALIDDAHALDAIVHAISHLERRTPGSLVIVHGGGAAVDRQLARLGMATERREGIRITPPDQMEQIAGVLAGAINAKLTATLLAEGVRAVGMTLAGGGLAHTARATRYAFDPGQVGEIRGGSPDVVRSLLGGGFVPVISSIGADSDGSLLNVNADDAAAAVAGIVGARALVLLTDVPGVRGADGRTIPTLDAGAAEALIASGVITGGMIPKVRSAADTATRCGVPVVIAPWADPSALATLADGGRAGTAFLAAQAVCA